jgi:hypothetical protein
VKRGLHVELGLLIYIYIIIVRYLLIQLGQLLVDKVHKIISRDL